MVSENTKKGTLRRFWGFFCTNRHVFFKGEAGHCKGLGIFSFWFSFISKQYQVLQQDGLCRIMPFTHTLVHSQHLQIFYNYKYNICRN